jgi:hypothetical protein
MTRKMFQTVEVYPALRESLVKTDVSTTADTDPVNHPSHYTFGHFEVIDVLQDWFPSSPLLWQVVKYVARAQHKGNMLQDLKKAQFYLNKAIEQLEVDLSKEKI